MFPIQNDEWKNLPVETADEVISYGDMRECKRLENWNRWLKIRKEQHKHIGLMICRNSTSLIMNQSDKYRSKVECNLMVDQAQKLKINNEYTRDRPYSMNKEIQKFTNIYIPDVILIEKGIRCNNWKDARDDFETRIPYMSLRNELGTLKRLRAVKSPEKLAIVGKNVFDEIAKSKRGYKGPIPSIRIELAPENEECDYDAPVCAVRINDLITKSIIDGNSDCKTCTLNTKPINAVKVGEDLWDEIIIENCGEITIHYKWKREECPATKYDSILKNRLIGRFYFDTRIGTLGPGQIERLQILFRPNVIGLYREPWLLQVEILGRLDPIFQINIQLQGCAISNVDNKAIAMKLQKDIEQEGLRTLCSNLTDGIIQNIFRNRDSSRCEKYLHHDYKMNYLYRVTQTEKPLSIDELFSQCMRLEKSFREKYLDVISRTAVTLLNKDILPENDRMNQHELHAYKTMYVAVDCIDLLLSTYEPDFNEVLQEENIKLTNKIRRKSKISIKKKVVLDNSATTAVYDVAAPETNIVKYKTIRKRWLDMMKPMVCKRLEWAVGRIVDYDTQWPEHIHEINDTATKNDWCSTAESEL